MFLADVVGLAQPCGESLSSEPFFTISVYGSQMNGILADVFALYLAAPRD